MPKDFEVIIGLEVHAQMNTKSKMFCACDNDAFGKAPNTTVCPICMGHPGTLPVPNEEAVKKALRAAVALKCRIEQDNHLDRKNYFYPDLPMGFQISQYDFPLSRNGTVSFDGGKICGVVRLHIENDAGKLVHAGGRSYCDYNRAGTPLMEIVTQPDLCSAKDAVAFAKELRRILIAVDASEVDMFKGMMRFDASISLRPRGEHKLYPRSEIKNLNSFKSLEKALVFEEKRLRKLWEEGAPPKREVTVHWDDEKEIGVILRDKESAADYRYFPEPDIPPLHFDEAILAGIGMSVGELPQEKREAYIRAGLDASQAMMLVEDLAIAKFFDAVSVYTGNPKRTASIILTQLLGFLKAAGKELSQGPTADDTITLLRSVDSGTISAHAGKEVLEKMVRTGKDALTILKEERLGQIVDTVALEEMVKRALEANPQAVEDIRNGKEKALGALVGFVMKETRGQADPTIVNDLVRNML